MKKDELLKKLIEERDALIEQYPELKKLQERINQIAERAGNDPLERAHLVFKLMMEHLRNDLIPAIERLERIKKGLSKKDKDKKAS